MDPSTNKCPRHNEAYNIVQSKWLCVAYLLLADEWQMFGYSFQKPERIPSKKEKQVAQKSLVENKLVSTV